VAEVAAAGAAGAGRPPRAAGAQAARVAAGVADSKRLYVYGVHAVGAVLERSPERILELWVAAPREDLRARDLRERAERIGLKVQAAEGAALAKLVGAVSHQGAVAAVRPLKPWNEDDLMTAVDGRLATQDHGPDENLLQRDPLLLVLDGVTDPHNLGACLRTADAAGVQALVIPRDRSAAVDGIVSKVAAGATEFVPVASVINLARTLAALKQRGIWVVGTDAHAEQSVYGADLARPLALVLGAEGVGLRRLTRERCDFLVRIPMAGQVKSLNVSVAAGIALFEARRQRDGARTFLTS